MVYSTLHTNSAIATIARLFDLGLKPYVVTTALAGIIAQRLVRQICPDCRQEVAVDPLLRTRLGSAFADVDRVFRGKGCPTCHGSGYKGRVGIYEVLTLDDDLRDRIGSGASVLEIRRLVRQKGLRSIAHHALERVQAGATSLEEILRVLGPQAGED
jgi:type II secretory ATPase GspE/PulE/Tfp pilus assembly ATPase PilB-like protein